MDYPGDELVNRRNFLFGALIAPVGAIVAAKCHLTLPKMGTNIPKTPNIWAKEVWPEITRETKKLWGTGICETHAHRMHQEALSKWLAEKVDNEVFKMMKGDFDGQKS